MLVGRGRPGNVLIFLSPPFGLKTFRGLARWRPLSHYLSCFNVLMQSARLTGNMDPAFVEHYSEGAAPLVLFDYLKLMASWLVHPLNGLVVSSE